MTSFLVSSGEQQPYPFEIVERLEVVEKVRLAAHDQLLALALQARPACQPRVDELGSELVEFGLGRVRAPSRFRPSRR